MPTTAHRHALGAEGGFSDAVREQSSAAATGDHSFDGNDTHIPRFTNGRGRADVRKSQAEQGQASLASSIANLCNTIIGTGMLATPGAFRYTGLFPGMFLVILCGMTSAAGLLLLTLCADTLGGRSNSFFSIAMRTVPRGARFFDAAIAVKCFGVSISYLIICGQLMPQVLLSFAKALDVHERLPDLVLDRSFWIFLFMVALCPLCFMRRLDSLRHTSYLSMLAVFYLVIIIIYYSIPAKKAHLPPPGEVHLIHIDGHHFVSIVPVFIFAFTCAQNMLPVHNELRATRAAHFGQTRRAVLTSIGLAGSIYLLVGVLGYLSFGSNVGGNIITMYPDSSLFVCFGRVSIVILTLCSYPLQVHPCRAALDKVFAKPSRSRLPPTSNQVTNGNGAHHANGNAAADQYRDYESSTDSSNPHTSLLGRNCNDAELADDDSIDTLPPAPEMSLQKLCVLTCLILVSTFIIALLVDDLGLILGFVGSVGSTSISFILPGILFSTLHKEGPRSRLRRPAQALAIYGFIVMSLSLAANILKLYNTIPSTTATLRQSASSAMLGISP